MDPLTAAQIWTRFGAPAALSTAVCLAVGFVLLRTTGVPPTYPPFSPLPIASGAIGGALLVTLGYLGVGRAHPRPWHGGRGVRRGRGHLARGLLLPAVPAQPHNLAPVRGSHRSRPGRAGIVAHLGGGRERLL